MNRLGTRTPGNQVNNAGHRSSSIEGVGNALDHLDLPEIHGRNLQQAEPASLLAEERQTVRQETRVASAHPLDPYARGAESGRCGLNPKASHFIEHHDDIAW